MTTSTLDCEVVEGHATPYVERALPVEQNQLIERHLKSCPACRETVEKARAVHTLLGNVTTLPKGPEAFLEALPTQTSSWMRLLGAAPWWGVSVVMHALVLALAGLISMTLNMPQGEEAVVMMTELQPRPEVNAEQQEKPKEQPRNALESDHETPPTDPTSKDASDIVVPPEFLSKAEIGDHWETNNPDRPDTGNAFGNPDSHIFYSEKGNDEAAGGGGVGGTTLDDVIGLAGGGSPGSGGGWGGGHGSGIGTDKGSGRGSFGSRNGGGRKTMVKRHGGSKATETVVDKALEWLARNQEADGHWDAKKHEATCAEKDWADVGMTGIALLAFLGAGHTEKVGQYKDNVARAVYWLVEKQIKDGPRKGSWVTVMYSNGIAGLALAEAAGMSKHSDAKEAAQMAINYIQEAQHQYMAWNYYADKDENARNDTSVSGWQVMALKSAKVAGLKVNALAFEGALNWLEVGQELPKDLKEVSYDWMGGMMAYGGTKMKIEGKSASMTAAAAIMRLFLGQKPEHPGITGPCNLMAQKKGDHGCWLPNRERWAGVADSGIDYYYWYYGTLAMFQKGGDHWKQWNEALKETIPPLQRLDGAFSGSFDPIGKGRIPDGGRVFSTALAALCMEVYYRYAKINEK